jgi:hypothetical protein
MIGDLAVTPAAQYHLPMITLGKSGHQNLVMAYCLSISRMSTTLRLTLIAASALPLLPFFLAVHPCIARISNVATMVAMLGATIAFIPLHEAAHGLTFWLYSRRVSFGFRPWTAMGPVFYAASVGSLFSARQYQLACIAPQFVTVVFVVIALFHFSDAVTVAAAYGAALNLGGASADLYAFARLARFGDNAVVEDALDGMEVYLPQAEAS